jgi:hypothetical protein
MQPLVLTRRRLLDVCFGAIAALTVTRLCPVPARAASLGVEGGPLTSEARAIVAAIVPVMLADSLPRDSRFEAAVRDVVAGTQVAVAGLTPSVQGEIAQLFGILSFPPARYLIAGVHRPWDRADAGEIEGFLQAWRTSPVAKLRSAYDALHQLIGAAWYGNPESWPRIGYPGPPKLGNE